MAQSRKTKTRRDQGHARRPTRTTRTNPADELTLLFLMRLWAGDTLTIINDDLHLVRVNGNPEDVFRIPLRLLDELEFERGWIRPPEVGQRVQLTYAGKQELTEFMRRRKPGQRAVENLAGERLELRR